MAQPHNKTIVPSAARTTAIPVVEQDSRRFLGLSIFLDITAAPGAQSLTLAIEAKDPASGKWVALLTGAAITATGTTHYQIYPGITDVANQRLSIALPDVWRVTVTHSGAGSWTYSVGATLID